MVTVKQAAAAAASVAASSAAASAIAEHWREEAAARRRAHCVESGFVVCIIGAGMSGICAAIKLMAAGIPVQILESGSSFGGTWCHNTYPDCGCDVASMLYSYSFAQKWDWTRKWAKQEEILGYFQGVAADHGLHEVTSFGRKVLSCVFDDAAQQWTVTTAAAHSANLDADLDADLADAYSVDLQLETLRFGAVLSAVGQLDVPKVPELPGAESFRGPMFHTARWDHSVSLEGKRVVGVGTGASAIQAYPALAGVVEHLVVAQRSPTWIAPKGDFRYEDRPALRALLRWVPLALPLYRLRLFLQNELTFQMLINASGPLSGANAVARKVLGDVMVAQAGPGVAREQVIPTFPVGCKRTVLSDDWMPMFARENVTLVSSPVARVTEAGVVFEDGRFEACDAIVLATGFEAAQFLAQVDVRGTGGRRLEEDEWDGVPHAFKGMAVAGFPNLFLLYGPGTNLGHSSIIFMVEAQVDYVVRHLSHMLDKGCATMEVRREPYERDFEQLQADLEKTVFAADNCDSWYKRGDFVVNNWSGSCTAYASKLHGIDSDAFIMRRRNGDKRANL